MRSSILVLLISAASVFAAPRLDDDTTCLLDESEWYAPEKHVVELQKFLDVASRAPKTLHVLDVFGVSCRMQSAFEEKGFVGFSYDIKLSKTHDITSESGFKVLLEKAARLHPEGLIAGAPPCSLFTAASSSVHKRTKLHPCGNLANYKVRLAQRIWGSFVMFLMLVLQNTPTLRLMVEQPCSSWGFKQLFFVSLIGIFKLYIVKTHMGFFNHDLCKCSHLLTNMRSLSSLTRTMTKKDRKMIQDRFDRRQRRRSKPRVYHVKVHRPDGSIGWQGGPDLPLTATFTRTFCRAVRGCWENRNLDEAVPKAPHSKPGGRKPPHSKSAGRNQQRQLRPKKVHRGHKLCVAVRRSARLAAKAAEGA
ncbi:unnamed protein product [Cladocopium goreaui]|uniref:Uncharacterized protein n=1 Tax=Cladocopium goreaui TaxID=2562237 RepID=A0A9P1DLT6_9DINO|nr:unnamed protein product [Cladocopium goreaui]CAI4010998.1 unnamed protein product [Cladocopium goreaui]